MSDTHDDNQKLVDNKTILAHVAKLYELLGEYDTWLACNYISILHPDEYPEYEEHLVPFNRVAVPGDEKIILTGDKRVEVEAILRDLHRDIFTGVSSEDMNARNERALLLQKEVNQLARAGAARHLQTSPTTQAVSQADLQAVIQQETGVCRSNIYTFGTTKPEGARDYFHYSLQPGGDAAALLRKLKELANNTSQTKGVLCFDWNSLVNYGSNGTSIIENEKVCSMLIELRHSGWKIAVVDSSTSKEKADYNHILSRGGEEPLYIDSVANKRTVAEAKVKLRQEAGAHQAGDATRVAQASSVFTSPPSQPSFVRREDAAEKPQPLSPDETETPKAGKH